MTQARHLQEGSTVRLPDDDCDQVVVSVQLAKSRPGEVIVKTNGGSRYLPETEECTVVSEPAWVAPIREAVR